MYIENHISMGNFDKHLAGLTIEMDRCNFCQGDHELDNLSTLKCLNKICNDCLKDLTDRDIRNFCHENNPGCEEYEIDMFEQIENLRK